MNETLLKHTTTALIAASASATLVFGVGFVLGAIRTIVLAPRFGELKAGLTELPFIMYASWIVTNHCLSKFKVPRQWPIRFIMGVTSFLFLLCWECVMSVALMNMTSWEFWNVALFPSTLHGKIGLCGQMLYGLFPVIKLYTASLPRTTSESSERNKSN